MERMQREFVIIHEKETAARTINTRIDAIRTKDITKKGVRVYADGKIGISGGIGAVDEDGLVREAMENLSCGISYPYALSRDKKDHRDYLLDPLSSDDVVAIAESVLDTLRREHPAFDFSQTIAFREVRQRIYNTAGLDLEYRDGHFAIELLVKEKKSANVIDGILVCTSRKFDAEAFWSFADSYLQAHLTPASFPEGEVLPVFTLEMDTLLGFLNRSLHGERFATGSSLFSGRLGEQLFHEKITLEQSYNPHYTLRPFFDAEGVVLPEDRYVLIDQGRLVNVFTDKKTAALYNLPHTGAASGAYDEMPSLRSVPLHFRTDTSDLKAALNGQLALLVVLSSGGEFTPDGSFAAPVQLGFLFDGEKLLGRLPECTIRSHLFKMLGSDYIGTFDNTALYVGDVPTQLQGYYMQVIR